MTAPNLKRIRRKASTKIEKDIKKIAKGLHLKHHTVGKSLMKSKRYNKMKKRKEKKERYKMQEVDAHFESESFYGSNR